MSLGFLASNAKNIPIILPYLTPSYYNATVGMKILSDKGILLPENQGFEVIETLFLDYASTQNSPDIIKTISLLSITLKNASLRFGEKRAREYRPIELKLSNGQKVEWSLDNLQSKIDKLFDSAIFKWSYSLFLVGLIFEIIYFCLEYNASALKKCRISPSL